MSKIRQAVVYSSASRYTIRLLGLVWTMIIARLLTPEEIGTFAVASAIVMVMSEFKLLGAGSYLVREKDISGPIIRSALGLTLIISWVLGLSVFLIAPFVAGFYNLPPVETIFRVLAASFFLAPFISIPTALLTRHYQFKTLFYIKLSAKVTGLASTIILILFGFSYYSLAWGQLIIVVVEFLIMSRYRPVGSPWIPHFSGLGSIAKFGIYTSLANLFKKTIVTAPDMIIGKMGSTLQVGLFSRGLGFVEFLSQSLMMGVSPVALPYLSETRRNGGNVAIAYTRASVLLGGLVLPVLAVASMASLPAIRLFFGEQWDFAAPLTSWLALWAMFRVIHGLSNPLLVASGKEKLMVIKEFVVLAVFFTGIIIAFPYGLEAVAITFVFGGMFELILTTVMLWSTINLNITRFVIAWLPNIAVTLVCWIMTLVIREFIDFNSSDYWSPILVIMLVLPVAWLVALKVFRHPLYEEIHRLKRGLLSKLKLGR